MAWVRERGLKVAGRDAFVHEGTLLELADASAVAMATGPNRELWKDSRSGSRQLPAWYGGTHSEPVDQMVDRLLRDGWQDGLMRVRQMADGIEAELPRPTVAKRRPRWKDSGDEVDRDRLMNGQIDTMWRKTMRERVTAPQPVTVYATVGGSAHVSAADLFWCGAAAVAITERLEEAGYRVDVRAAFHGQSCSSDRARFLQIAQVKAPQEPLRADLIAYVLAHASCFRSLFIADSRARTVHVSSGASSPLGGLRQALEDFAPVVQQTTIPPADIVLERVLDRASAVQAYMDALTVLAQREEAA